MTTTVDTNPAIIAAQAMPVHGAPPKSLTDEQLVEYLTTELARSATGRDLINFLDTHPDVTIRIGREGSGYGGYFELSSQTITIGHKTAMSYGNRGVATLAHEIQHAIDLEEGGGMGAHRKELATAVAASPFVALRNFDNPVSTALNTAHDLTTVTPETSAFTTGATVAHELDLPYYSSIAMTDDGTPRTPDEIRENITTSAYRLDGPNRFIGSALISGVYGLGTVLAVDNAAKLLGRPVNTRVSTAAGAAVGISLLAHDMITAHSWPVDEAQRATDARRVDTIIDLIGKTGEFDDIHDAYTTGGLTVTVLPDREYSHKHPGLAGLYKPASHTVVIPQRALDDPHSAATLLIHEGQHGVDRKSGADGPAHFLKNIVGGGTAAAYRAVLSRDNPADAAAQAFMRASNEAEVSAFSREVTAHPYFPDADTSKFTHREDGSLRGIEEIRETINQSDGYGPNGVRRFLASAISLNVAALPVSLAVAGATTLITKKPFLDTASMAFIAGIGVSTATAGIDAAHHEMTRQ